MYKYSGPSLFFLQKNRRDEIYLSREIECIFTTTRLDSSRCTRLLTFLNQQNGGELTLSLDARARGAVHLMRALLIGARACIPPIRQGMLYIRGYVCIRSNTVRRLTIISRGAHVTHEVAPLKAVCTSHTVRVYIVSIKVK